MIDNSSVTNKVYVTTIRKRAFRVSDKTIVVIDESLVRRFSIDDDTWFIEEESENGILLRITKKM